MLDYAINAPFRASFDLISQIYSVNTAPVYDMQERLLPVKKWKRSLRGTLAECHFALRIKNLGAVPTCHAELRDLIVRDKKIVIRTPRVREPADVDAGPSYKFIFP
jgi:hypothetical protein